MESAMIDGRRATTKLRPIVTCGQWIGPPERPLMAWLARPVDGIGEVGVVIVPPVGYEYWNSHRTLRTLAERLARNGCLALRFDFDGTGDSAGDQWDPGRLEAWQRNIGQAADALRELGVTRLVVIGLRIGATLALTQGAAVGADAVVAWAPVARGSRYVRELQLIGLAVPETPELPERAGVVQAGSVFSVETLAGLGAIDVSALPDRPATRVLVVDRSDKPPSAPILDRLRALGVEPDHVVREGAELFLDQPTEYATVPDGVVDEITAWVGSSEVFAESGDAPARRTTARVAWQGVTVEEEVVELGRLGFVGILTRPPSGVSRGTVVWLNSGSEHHVGPGRAWVEYARTLALSGCTSLRVDFSGWGDSPDLGHAQGRPYDQHGVAEVGEIVDALRDSGHSAIVLAGLCAGAWIALRAALDVDVEGVLALNPQLYWQPGDPVEANIETETHVRRLSEMRRDKRGAALGAWSFLDMVGVRPPAARWVDALARRQTPVLAVFAEGDDGLEYIQDRIARAFGRARRGGLIDVTTVPGIDHPMHRHWQRPSMVDAIAAWLDKVMPPAATVGTVNRNSTSDDGS
jgi:dienelactone hydrolase